MKRTQLYLDEDLARLLATESRRRGTTVSALVRDAAAREYGGRQGEDGSVIIERLAGVWANRNDLGGTGRYVRRLRKSDRPRRWRKSGSGKVPTRQRRAH